MKTMFALLLLALFIIVIQFSCNKDNITDSPQKQQPPISLDSMLQCNKQINWDSTLIHKALIGKWQWEFISCFWNPEKANNSDFKNLTIEFKPNDSLIVTLNGQITQKSSWNISKLNDGYFKLSVTPVVIQIPGKVLFCGDRVLFFDSYIDGCDNYFKKQN